MTTGLGFAFAAFLALALAQAGQPAHMQAAVGLLGIAFVLGFFGGST
jgi:hypothetical protein